MKTHSLIPLATLVLSVALHPFSLYADSSWESRVAVSQSYDSNIYLTDLGNLARKGSWMSTASPFVSWKPSGDFQATYQAHATRYWQASSEDHIRHAVSMRYQGSVGDTRFRFDTTQTWVQGSRDSVFFLAGRSAHSSTAVRERRAQWQNRMGVNLQHEMDGGHTLRVFGNLAGFDLKVHEQVGTPGYEHFVDRYEVAGGAEWSRSFAPGSARVGFRHGYQNQGRQGGRPSDRSNHFHNLYLGWNGKSGDRWQWNLEAGPAWHRYNDGPGDVRSTSLRLQASGSLRLHEAYRLEGAVSNSRGVAGTGLLSNTVRRASLAWVYRPDPSWQFRASAAALGLDYHGAPVQDWKSTGGIDLEYTSQRFGVMQLKVERTLGKDRILDRPNREFVQNWFSLSVSSLFW